MSIRPPRHNREQLPRIADAAFRRHGVQASLAEIARTRGIAIGTLYRHFPTHQALLQALIHDQVTSPILATAAVEGSDLNAGVESMRAAAGVLLAKAQKANAIRPDVSAAEVFALARGAGTASQYASADPDRLQRLVVEGLMPR